MPQIKYQANHSRKYNKVLMLRAGTSETGVDRLELRIDLLLLTKPQRTASKPAAVMPSTDLKHVVCLRENETCMR